MMKGSWLKSKRDSRSIRSLFRGLASRSMIIIALIISVVPVVTNAQEQASRSRTVQETPFAQASIILNEAFLNRFLDAMFTQLGPPSFPLALASINARPDLSEILSAHASPKPTAQCSSEIVLERERSGVRTSVRLEAGRITAPLAFSGSYNAGLLGCLSFEGTAYSVVTLEFDPQRSAILARVRLQSMELSGLPVLANNIVAGMVQSSIDRRFNPYELFRAEQLSPVIPIKAAGGSLRLRATTMRPEIVPGALRITVVYDFERAP